jgi:hypothetical protein
MSRLYTGQAGQGAGATHPGPDGYPVYTPAKGRFLDLFVSEFSMSASFKSCDTATCFYHKLTLGLDSPGFAHAIQNPIHRYLPGVKGTPEFPPAPNESTSLFTGVETGLSW